MKPRAFFGDFDSLACFAGYCETTFEMECFVDREVRRMFNDSNCAVMYGFLEHPEKKYNYRRQCAYTVPYKSTRGSKPPLTEMAKRYMHKKYSFEWVTHREAEDELCIRVQQYGPEWAVAGAIDKDCYQHPFTFYNYKKHEMFTVSPLEGWYNFCVQMLIGDKTDDIKGLSGVKGAAGIGKKTAQTLLTPAQHSVDALTQVVAAQYAEAGREWRYMQEMATLLRIQLYDDERWLFPVSEDDYYNQYNVVPRFEAKWASLDCFLGNSTEVAFNSPLDALQ